METIIGDYKGTTIGIYSHSLRSSRQSCGTLGGMRSGVLQLIKTADSGLV